MLGSHQTHCRFQAGTRPSFAKRSRHQNKTSPEALRRTMWRCRANSSTGFASSIKSWPYHLQVAKWWAYPPYSFCLVSACQISIFSSYEFCRRRCSELWEQLLELQKLLFFQVVGYCRRLVGYCRRLVGYCRRWKKYVFLVKPCFHDFFVKNDCFFNFLYCNPTTLATPCGPAPLPNSSTQWEETA